MRAKGNGDPELCASNLLRLFRGEVPFERVKGLDPRLIDRPAGDLNAEVQQDAEWLLENYEPRVSVNSINIEPSEEANGGFLVTANVEEEEE
jgi:phage baseplate assembly protein W